MEFTSTSSSEIAAALAVASVEKQAHEHFLPLLGFLFAVICVREHRADMLFGQRYRFRVEPCTICRVFYSSLCVRARSHIHFY